MHYNKPTGHEVALELVVGALPRDKERQRTIKNEKKARMSQKEGGGRGQRAKGRKVREYRNGTSDSEGNI